MTSTNDGKDVKSNQTSGQKGKTYYIELYKSLDASLNAEGSLSERVVHLSAAWRRVHTLCLHSAPSTHPHLLTWIQRHTARTVFQSEWQSTTCKDEHVKLENAINDFVQECQNAATGRDGVVLPWESQLVARAEWFKGVLRNPWGHPVLKALLEQKETSVSTEQILEWLKEERGAVFAARLRQLALSKKCVDVALAILTPVMDRMRACRHVVPDHELVEEKETPEPVNKELTFQSILTEEAGFNEVWDQLTDLEVVLLHKCDRNARVIDLAKAMPLGNGYQVVERLLNKLEVAPKEKRIWKNAKDVATLIIQVMITRCMVVPRCGGQVLVVLYWMGRALVRCVPAAKIARAACTLCAPASSARHLHTLANAVHAQESELSEELKPYVVELYVRAITSGMNELEKLKMKPEYEEKEARATEYTLASWFIQLGQLLSHSARMKCECILTAFSLHPSPAMYDRIKQAPHLPTTLQDIQPKQEAAAKSEFGSWANDSRTQTNLVKTSETLNMQHMKHQANTLSTTILNEGEALGLDAELCQDIIVLLSGPRVKTLSCDMDRQALLDDCRAHMERTQFGTRALTTELKYLNLDPANYQHLPEEDEDEDDVYYGIEKGYEHLVEIEPQPEEIWEDAYDPERTRSAQSSYEEEYIIKKKKSKSDSSDSEDPLSTVAEKQEKKKDRPHSKERSKERKKKTKEDRSKDTDADKKQDEGKDKKKEKKERKKREKKEKKTRSPLIGMKITKITEDDPLGTMDVDYDGQGKASEMKSSEATKLNEKPPSQLAAARQRAASAIKNAQMSYVTHITLNTPKSEAGSSTNFSPSNHIPNVGRSNSSLREEVKKGITKLIQFRRHKMAESSGSGSSSPQQPSTSRAPTPPSPLIGTKVANTSLVFNQQQNDMLNNMRSEVKAFKASFYPPEDPAAPAPCSRMLAYYRKIPRSPREMMSRSHEALNLTPKNISPASQSSLFSDLRSPPVIEKSPQTDKTHLSSYESFLQELQKNANAGLFRGEPPPAPTPVQAKKKQMKPISRVTPVVPKIKTESDVTASASNAVRTDNVSIQNVKCKSRVGQVVHTVTKKESILKTEPRLLYDLSQAKYMGPKQEPMNNMEPRVSQATYIGPKQESMINTEPRVSHSTYMGPKQELVKTEPRVSPATYMGPRQEPIINTEPKVSQATYMGPKLESMIKTEPRVSQATYIPKQESLIRTEPRVSQATYIPKQESLIKTEPRVSHIGQTVAKQESLISPQCAKPVVQPKKVDVAPNTFARLSYMHKNKLNEKNKQQTDPSMSLHNDISDEIDRRIADLRTAKVKAEQAKMEFALTRAVNAAMQGKPNEPPRVEVQSKETASNEINQQHPLLTNILRQNTVTLSSGAQKPPQKPRMITPHKNTALTEKDQQDLLKLLGQKNILNRPQMKNSQPKNVNNQQFVNNSSSNDLNKISTDSVPVFLNNSITVSPVPVQNQVSNTPKSNQTMTIGNTGTHQGQSNEKGFNLPMISNTTIMKTTAMVQNKVQVPPKQQKKARQKAPKQVNVSQKTGLEVNKNQGGGKKYVPKPPVSVSKCTTDYEEQDWTKVLDAIRAHKTPSRGPNALDMLYKKDSFEKVNERNQRTNTPLPTTQANNNLNTTSTVSTQVNSTIRQTESSKSSTVVRIQKQSKKKMSSLKQDNITATKNIASSNPVKLYPEVTKHPHPQETTKDADPFISGIPNSDYEILEELMDDDLRQEIGELFSDEETYYPDQLETKSCKPSESVNQNVGRKVKNLDSLMLNKTNSNELHPTTTSGVQTNTKAKPQIISNEKVNISFKNLVGSRILRQEPTTMASKVQTGLIYNVNNTLAPTNVTSTTTSQMIYNPAPMPAAQNLVIIDPYGSTCNVNQNYVAVNNAPNVVYQQYTGATPDKIIISQNYVPNVIPPATVNVPFNHSLQSVTSEVPFMHIQAAPRTTTPFQTSGAPNEQAEDKVDIRIRRIIEPDITNKSTIHIVKEMPPNIPQHTFDPKLLSNKIDTTKTNERKVLSEVQEKITNVEVETKSPEKIDPVNIKNQRSFEFEENNQANKDKDRLIMKRLSIINRNITSNSLHQAIPLTYTPLKAFQTAAKTEEMQKDVKNQVKDTPKLDNTIIEPVITVDAKQKVLINTNHNRTKDDENKSSCRRILLRSSNKVETETIRPKNSNKGRLKDSGSQKFEENKIDEQTQKDLGEAKPHLNEVGKGADTACTVNNLEMEIDVSASRVSKRLKDRNRKNEKLVCAAQDTGNKIVSTNESEKSALKTTTLQNKTTPIENKLTASHKLNKLVDEIESAICAITESVVSSPISDTLEDEDVADKVKQNVDIKTTNMPLHNETSAIESLSEIQSVTNTMRKQCSLKTSILRNKALCIDQTDKSSSSAPITNENLQTPKLDIHKTANKELSKNKEIDKKIDKGSVVPVATVDQKPTLKLNPEENKNSQQNEITKEDYEPEEILPVINTAHKPLSNANTVMPVDARPFLKSIIENNDKDIISLSSESDLDLNKGKKLLTDKPDNKDIISLSSESDLDLNKGKKPPTDKPDNKGESDKDLNKGKMQPIDKLVKTSAGEAKLTSEAVPQSFKDSIKFEEIPIPGNKNPWKRCVRIVLPNNKSFKATVQGKVNVSFDTLFEEPALKKLLLSSFDEKKRYLINMQQLSNTDHRIVETQVQGIELPEPRQFNSTDTSEVVNLISDDEEETYQTITTATGSFKVKNIDEETFNKHKEQLQQTCAINLQRCDRKCKTEVLVGALLEDLGVNDPTRTDVIEINDSSSDDETSQGHTGIDILKDMLLKDLGVAQTKPTKEQRNEVQTIISNKRPSRNRKSKYHRQKDSRTVSAETKQRSSSRPKRSEVPKTNNRDRYSKIITHDCYVKLINCDNIVKEMREKDEAREEAALSDEVIACFSDDVTPPLSRSGSFSILNELDSNQPTMPRDEGSSPVMRVFDIILALGKQDNSGKTSPVMEAFDMIVAVQESFNESPTISPTLLSEKHLCTSDWFETKRNIHLLNLSYKTRTIDEIFEEIVKNKLDISTDCETDAATDLSVAVSENVHDVAFTVLRLTTIMTKYFEDNPIIYDLKSIAGTDILPKTPLKRKLQDSVETAFNKIIKTSIESVNIQGKDNVKTDAEKEQTISDHQNDELDCEPIPLTGKDVDLVKEIKDFPHIKEPEDTYANSEVGTDSIKDSILYSEANNIDISRPTESGDCVLEPENEDILPPDKLSQPNSPSLVEASNEEICNNEWLKAADSHSALVVEKNSSKNWENNDAGETSVLNVNLLSDDDTVVSELNIEEPMRIENNIADLQIKDNDSILTVYEHENPAKDVIDDSGDKELHIINQKSTSNPAQHAMRVHNDSVENVTEMDAVETSLRNVETQNLLPDNLTVESELNIAKRIDENIIMSVNEPEEPSKNDMDKSSETFVASDCDDDRVDEDVCKTHEVYINDNKILTSSQETEIIENATQDTEIAEFLAASSCPKIADVQLGTIKSFPFNLLDENISSVTDGLQTEDQTTNTLEKTDSKKILPISMTCDDLLPDSNSIQKPTSPALVSNHDSDNMCAVEECLELAPSENISLEESIVEADLQSAKHDENEHLHENSKLEPNKIISKSADEVIPAESLDINFITELTEKCNDELQSNNIMRKEDIKNQNGYSTCSDGSDTKENTTQIIDDDSKTTEDITLLKYVRLKNSAEDSNAICHSIITENDDDSKTIETQDCIIVKDRVEQDVQLENTAENSNTVCHKIITDKVETNKSKEKCNLQVTIEIKNEENTYAIKFETTENSPACRDEIKDNNNITCIETKLRPDLNNQDIIDNGPKISHLPTVAKTVDADDSYVYETEVVVEVQDESNVSDKITGETPILDDSQPDSIKNKESDCTDDEEIVVEKTIEEVECDEMIFEKNATLVYKDDSGVILKGIEYEDPEMGTCYVFPLTKSSDDTGTSGSDVLNSSVGSTIEVIQVLETSTEDQDTEIDQEICDAPDLQVTKPKVTYSKRNLKRKSNMKDTGSEKRSKRSSRSRDSSEVRITEKKYRKGKNIDAPKLSAVAIAESSNMKKFRRRLDYYSTVGFSYSITFSTEFIEPSELLKIWPINSPIKSGIQEEHESGHALFADLDQNDDTIRDPLQQTFVEEITADYNEANYLNSQTKETNFNMGFGEGSGRVIQNLSGDTISNVSAATLSDVKHTQPCLLSENFGFIKSSQQEIQTINRYLSYVKLKDKVRSFFKNTTFELTREFEENMKDSTDNYDASSFPFGLFNSKCIEPFPIETVVQVVQVGQLPVSAAAQNPVTCDPRVTQVSNASPSQCLVENSPDDSQPEIKTEYTELTTADLNLPMADDYVHHNQTFPAESQKSTNMSMNTENIPIETELIKSEVKIEIEEESPDEIENDTNEYSEEHNHINNVNYLYNSNNSNPSTDSVFQALFDSDKQDNSEMAELKAQNGSSEKTDQIAHAMNAAGITTSESANTRAQALVNILTHKLRQGAIATAPNSTNNFSKTTSINAMSLQQALASILPSALNQTNSTENNQQGQNNAPQVLHIVQGKNSSGNQITLVENTQQSVITTPNATPVLHIVQNKTVPPGQNSNGSPAPQSNTFSGLSLVDAGLQQGGNQLLHIVNTGNQKNNNAGQLLKRVNLLTNLANVQGSNEQKMVQFVCKSADGKAIQLNAPHQRSMVLRLQPIESTNVHPATPKPADSNQELSPTQTATSSASNKDSSPTQQEIKSRSVYEENYAKFIQNSNNKPTLLEKSNSLPKFNQAFGKAVFQDGNEKQNEMNSNSLPAVNTNTNSSESPAAENPINIDHIGQISSPPLLLRKSPATQTTEAPQNLVQQIKQTIAPMNIQTMHGGVIYTRQIPVNIGGGQTINLITVPSTELMNESGQKQQGNQGETAHDSGGPSIIKIVPQSQPPSNAEVSDEMNNDNAQQSTPQPQPVLTQMRIKLPMLSKAPQMVSGTRVVRPSFFQIQRNVIGGANQVYQQLVLTAAPPGLGQQTIRIPQAQTRQIKVPENQSSSESQMSSSTLEQLREFDMVLEQVKERSTVQPNSNSSSSFKLQTPSTDTTDSPVTATSTSVETTQVLYSIGSSQPLNVTYVNRKPSVSTHTTSTFVRSPDSSGIADSPTSSSHSHSHSHNVPHVSRSEASSSETTAHSHTHQQHHKPVRVTSKSKSRPKSSHLHSSLKLNSVTSKTSTQKPIEDEQTTQRILYILAEYKEQVENSPDKDKPAPRRRCNPPSNPGSSKRKKSGSRRSGGDSSPMDDSCRTMGSEDSSCGTSQGDYTESCMDSHSPQDSPRKVARKLAFEQDPPTPQPKLQPQRNVIVADGQTITVARGATGKPTTTVLMPANYLLPVSMVKGGQQIAIVTNRGPKLLTVGGGEGGTTNALLLQRLIGPAGLKPVLTRPGVRHVRLPTAALHNLQAFNLASATNIQPPDSTASPAADPPQDLMDTNRSNHSPWTDRVSEIKPDRASSPDESEPWNLPSSADPHDYSYEETVRTDNMDRTVLDPIQDRYSPDMEAQRIFDKMFDVDTKKSYIVDSPRCGYDIDASDCDDKPYQVVHKRDPHRQTRLSHVSAAALRHKYAILEHELRLQKSLSEECEDLGVDSPSASELFPEAELLFAASPAQDHGPDTPQNSHTPQPTLNQSVIQQDIDDQIATDQLLPRHQALDDRQELDVNLGLEDVGIVTVSEDGMRATIALDQEEFARAHPNTTFHSEPTDEGVVHPFTMSNLKSRHITSTIFHANRAPATVLMTAPQTTVISQATQQTSNNPIKYSDINNMIHTIPSTHTNNINLSSVLVKDEGLTRFDNILTDSRELHLSNTASAIVHSVGNGTQVIRRVCYDDKRVRDNFLMDEPDALIAGNDAKMVAEDSSRDATMGSMGDVDDGNSSPERHAELFWESNSASERSESRRPLEFSSDSDKCCKSPSYDETNSTDSSGVGTHMRLDSVIKEARGVDRSRSAEGSSADDTHPPLRTYPPKRLYHNTEGERERSLSGKTRAGERSPYMEVRRRASGRGVVKRGCHCCNGSPAPPRPKKPRQRKPTMDFTN